MSRVEKLLIVLAAVVGLASLMFCYCACTPSRELDPCDQELVEKVEGKCDGGFGLTDGFKTYIVCLNGNTAGRLHSLKGPDLVEKIERSAQEHGLESVNQWGELIKLCDECHCYSIEGPEGPQTHACMLGSR